MVNKAIQSKTSLLNESQILTKSSFKIVFGGFV